METFSASPAVCARNSPVPSEFPTQRSMTRSFDIYFDLHPNKRLSKQPWGWWFETTSPPYDVIVMRSLSWPASYWFLCYWWVGRLIVVTFYVLQWRHMNIMASHITSNSTVCSTVCLDNKGSIVVPHYWPYLMGIHRCPVDSPQKGLVMRKAFSCHDVIMY